MMAEFLVWVYEYAPQLMAGVILFLVAGLLLLAWISGSKEENRYLDEKWEREATDRTLPVNPRRDG